MTENFIEEFLRVYEKSDFEEFKSTAKNIENKIGYNFNKQENLWNALSVRGSRLSSEEFERLEFIGDSLLGAIIGLYIFEKLENSTPEKLTNYRKEITKNETLAQLAKKLGLNQIGKCLKIPNLSNNQLSDMFESIIGAIFIDTNKNFNETKKTINNIINIDEFTREIIVSPWDGKDPKSFLNEYIQKKYKGEAKLDFEYEHKGSQNNPRFACKVLVKNRKDEIILTATGEIKEKKKEAEKNACESLLSELKGKGEL